MICSHGFLSRSPRNPSATGLCLLAPISGSSPGNPGVTLESNHGLGAPEGKKKNIVIKVGRGLLSKRCFYKSRRLGVGGGGI